MRAWKDSEPSIQGRSTQDVPAQAPAAEKPVPERHLGFKSVNASSLPDLAIVEVTACTCGWNLLALMFLEVRKPNSNEKNLIDTQQSEKT